MQHLLVLLLQDILLLLTHASDIVRDSAWLVQEYMELPSMKCVFIFRFKISDLRLQHFRIDIEVGHEVRVFFKELNEAVFGYILPSLLGRQVIEYTISHFVLIHKVTRGFLKLNFFLLFLDLVFEESQVVADHLFCITKLQLLIRNMLPLDRVVLKLNSIYPVIDLFDFLGVQVLLHLGQSLHLLVLLLPNLVLPEGTFVRMAHWAYLHRLSQILCLFSYSFWSLNFFERPPIVLNQVANVSD